MYIVGLTGGIGSGKSTIASFFLKKNIPIYNSDIYAKKIMQTIYTLKINIIKLFGEHSYKNNELNTKYISNIIFNDSLKLKLLNKLVHPWVLRDFKYWMLFYRSFYCIKETALLFETGIDKLCDLIITVTAPQELRIQRVMKRDNIRKDDILKKIYHQWSDSKKMIYSDIIIHNISTIQKLEKIVEEIHTIILNKKCFYNKIFI